jgi:hypothetical protein
MVGGGSHPDSTAEGAQMIERDMRTGGVPSARARDHEVLQPLLNAMYNEFQELSKKKPHEPVSQSKVKVVNRVFEPVLALLQDEPQRKFLDLLDEDDLPENSDVVLMLGQALTAMRAFRGRYHDNMSGWRISDEAVEDKE